MSDRRVGAIRANFTLAILTMLTVGSPLVAATTPGLSAIVDPSAVCSTSQTMVIGVGSKRESILSMRVDKLQIDGRDAFQSLHRSVDPRDTTFDVTLVDAATLQPIHSTSSYVSPELRFEYAVNEARRVGTDGVVIERIALPEPAMPEGPGDEVITQAIRWRDGLSFRATMVDRWRGEGQQRVKPGTWRVDRRERVTTVGGAHDVYVVIWTPDDASFGITKYVTTARPNHVVKFEYRADPKLPPLVSETASFAAYCGSRLLGLPQSSASTAKSS